MNNDTFEAQVLQSALGYVRRGFSVFTVHSILESGKCTCGNENCNSPGKHPRTLRGVKDATNSEKLIRALFEQHPNSNIGIATGAVSGICVVDIDPRNGGNDSFAEYESVHSIPQTPECLTGGGGRHIYFAIPKGTSVKSGKFLAGVDFQSDGKYVVAPPSRHKSGASYCWDNELHIDDLKLSDLPKHIMDRVSNNRSDLDTRLGLSGLQIEGADRAQYLLSIGGSLRRRGSSQAVILAAIEAANQERCMPPVSDKSLRELALSLSKYEPTSAAERGGVDPANASWPSLRDLPPIGGKAPNLHPDLIPKALRAWVLDCAERLSVPPEFIYFPALSGLAVALGNRIGVTPKQKDFGWIVTAAGLWCALIASPGKKKSPALSTALQPLNRIDKMYRDEYNQQFERTKTECAILRHKIAGLEKRISANAGKKPTSDFESQLRELKSQLEESTPEHKRITIQDATVQKIADLLTQKSNQHGLGITVDELTTWMRALERPGQEGSRGFFLKAWNGYQSEAIDRIGRGSTFIEALCLVIVGGIQPDVFESFMSEARKGGFAADGLMQRFQLAVIPDISNALPIIDRPPNISAYDKVCEIFERIHRIQPDEVCANHYFNRPIPTIHFDQKAQCVMDDFLTRLESIIVKIEDPVLESHISKYRSTLPALALIFELVQAADAGLIGNPLGGIEQKITVGFEATQLALELTRYLLIHAKIIYGFNHYQEISAAHCLLDRVKIGEIESGSNLRTIYRKSWRGLCSPSLVRAGAEILEDHGYIKVEEKIKPGCKPSAVMTIRPELTNRAGDV